MLTPPAADRRPIGAHAVTAPRRVRWWFRAAALYGAVALVASLFGPPPAPAALFPQLAFTGTALAFQIAFWIIGGDPARYRPLMLAGVVEKLAFGVPGLMLTGWPGVPAAINVFAAIDLMLGLGFLLAWRSTPRLDDRPLASSPSRTRVKLPG